MVRTPATGFVGPGQPGNVLSPGGVHYSLTRQFCLCQYRHEQRMKKLAWLADSRSNVKSFPAGVQDDIGYALYAAQLGEMSPKAKPLHGLGGGVREIAANEGSGTYRAVYAVSIGDAIYVSMLSRRSPRPGLRHRSPK